MNSIHRNHFHHDCVQQGCSHCVNCFHVGNHTLHELTEEEHILHALGDDCTRVHVLVFHDDGFVRILPNARDDYSHHDIRLELVEGEVAVRMLLRSSPSDSHHGIRTEPVEVGLDVDTLLSTDMVEVKVSWERTTDTMSVTTVLHWDD